MRAKFSVTDGSDAAPNNLWYKQSPRRRLMCFLVATLMLGSAIGLMGCAGGGAYATGYSTSFYAPDYGPYYGEYFYNGDPYWGGGAYYNTDIIIHGGHHRLYYGGHHFAHDWGGGFGGGRGR